MNGEALYLNFSVTGQLFPPFCTREINSSQKSNNNSQISKVWRDYFLLSISVLPTLPPIPTVCFFQKTHTITGVGTTKNLTYSLPAFNHYSLSAFAQTPIQQIEQKGQKLYQQGQFLEAIIAKGRRQRAEGRRKNLGLSGF